jgi:hypothetical protein
MSVTNLQTTNEFQVQQLPWAATVQPTVANLSQNDSNVNQIPSINAKETSCHPNALLQLICKPSSAINRYEACRWITRSEVQHLIESGAEVNATYKSGMTPLRALFSLFSSGDITPATFSEVSQLLIESGANVNAKMCTERDERSILQTAFDCGPQIMNSSEAKKIAYFTFLRMLLEHKDIVVSPGDKFLIRALERDRSDGSWYSIAEMLIKNHPCVKDERDDYNRPPKTVHTSLMDKLNNL